MRKLFFALLLFGVTMNAQKPLIDWGCREYFTISAFVDPVGSIREKGLDLGAEIELVDHWGYVKAGFQSFGALQGGYLDAVGGAGLNFNTKPFEYFRLYTGIRLGVAFRGINDNDVQGYPLAGWEAGIDYNINEKWFIGINGNTDWREDFMYSGADPRLQASGRIRAGYKW